MKQNTELTEKMVKLAEKNGLLEEIYGQEVNRLLRLKYPLSDELALLWASQNGEKADEVSAFYTYREECKVKAREAINSYLTK